VFLGGSSRRAEKIKNKAKLHKRRKAKERKAITEKKKKFSVKIFQLMAFPQHLDDVRHKVGRCILKVKIV